MSLLEFTDRGIYCPRADVYLDPWKPVKRALITHGHSDHARWGHEHYLCAEPSRQIIQHRLNLSQIQTLAYGETLAINGVTFSFHPAGHIPGSAQIRVAAGGDVWVFTGDFKLQPDGISEPFEPVRCNTFITESTFGLPIYKWAPQQQVFDDVNQWWRKNRAEGRVSVLSGYALGKSQRLIRNVDASIGSIFTHGAIDVVNRVLQQSGVHLPPTQRITSETAKKEWEGALVICPPSAVGSPWIRKFLPYSLGVASGWMALRGTRRRRNADRGFVLSDHADWDELNTAVHETGASSVFVTHGYTDVFSRWLVERGLQAAPVKTEFEGELSEIAEGEKVEQSQEEKGEE